MDKKDYSQLKVLASQLEGQVCKELRPVKKYYQLMVFSGVFSAEARINRYPVPDPKTALIIIDIILSEFKHLGHDDCLFSLQYKDDLDEEWKDWKGKRGHSICEYEINENFIMIPPV
jgi:hypothetical protein